MDFTLRCNDLKCRAQLEDSAVVTTCSHVFCVSCSQSLGLATPAGSARICPACSTVLANPDDAVVTQLNPTEDYKTSVLSGLSPTIIMECAGRGLSFHSYQTNQEIIYQEFLARSLTDKYSSLSAQMDKVISEANTEIADLRDKLTVMHAEQGALEKKNHELGDHLREKLKTHQQLQKLYQSLKQQQLAAGLELAAEHDAEHFLQNAGRDGHYRNDRTMQSRSGSNGSGGKGGPSRSIHAWENQMQDSRAGMESSRGGPAVPATPSGHRSRLPLYGNNGTAMGKTPIGGDTPRQGMSYRPALNSIDPNVYGNGNRAGYGMSAGVKIGRQQQGPISRSGMGVSRSGLGGLNIR